MFNMRTFLTILILLFSIQSWSKADDIRDFEIEGISIGDSLLKFGNKDKIDSIKSSQQYKSKYTIYDIEKLINVKNYDYMSLTTKNYDNEYIVTSVSGVINYNELDKCLQKQKKIAAEVEKLLNYDEKEQKIYPSQRDKTGNSKIHTIVFYFKPYPSQEAISINCSHFSIESNIQRTLKVGASSEEFANFLIHEAYK